MQRLQTIASWIPLVLFIAIFVLLATFTVNLRLYIDDFPYFLGEPSLTHNFSAFVQLYTALHGIYRPLALAYYWVIYSLYELSPMLAHAIPLAIHIATGYGLYCVLKRHGMTYAYALIGGLIYALHPFATEQYMWLSANPGTLVNAIFIIQLFLLSRANSFREALIPICLLSLVATFLYESTFFYFLPLAYYMWIRFPEARKHRFVMVTSLVFPAILYIISKQLVQSTDPRPLVNSIGLLFHHASDAIDNLIKVHLDDYYRLRFWSIYQNLGWERLMGSPAIWTMGLVTIMGIIGTTLIHKGRNIKSVKHPLLFWALTFLASMVPLVANKEFYFGFRSLFLPTITGIIVLLWFIQKIGHTNTQKVIMTLGLWTISSFFLINIAIATKYQNQYASDMQMATTIARTIQREFPEAPPRSINILLKSETFFDSRKNFLHADHMLGCLFYEWSAIPCLAAKTNRIRLLAVLQADGRKTIQTGANYDTITDKRPLLVLIYKTDGSITIERIQR